MLAELTLLLHEMSDTLRGRPHRVITELPGAAVASGEAIVVVTGLSSPGKARLVEALEHRLRSTGISVRGTSDERLSNTVWRLHVHAETDLEGMVEGRLAANDASQGAEVVIPVDWEPVERSVKRVVERLVSRGVGSARLGE